MWQLVIFFFCFNASFVAFSQDKNVETLFLQAQIELNQGHYLLSLETLLEAQNQNPTLEQKAQLTGLEGMAYYQMHHFEKAESLLKQAVNFENLNQAKSVFWLMALGDMQAKKGLLSQAKTFYAKAMSLAKNDLQTQFVIQLAQINFLPKELRFAELEKIDTQLANLKDLKIISQYRLNMAKQALELENTTQFAFDLLTKAIANSTDPKLLAEAKSYLAQLYENQQRFEDAKILNQQALSIAKQEQISDLLIELEWRAARLYQAQNQANFAIAAYQNAVEQIEAIRQDIPVEYHNGRSSFRETLEPVYLGLADLLLQKAQRENDATQKNTLLHRAREAVELIKQSEVEDFLGGRCSVVAQKKALLDSVEPKTAIIYPIVLQNRLELLVSVGSKLHQFTQTVDAKTLQRAVKTMAHSLRTLSSFDGVSESIYRWLIAPLEPLLQENKIETLVMVPDGFLRLIPIAALKDKNHHFLIENYAIAISPGMTLLEPTPLHLKESKILLAGLSHPGEVVEHLPVVSLRDLGVSQTERSVDTLSNDANELIREPFLRERVQAQLSLPGVDKEMEGLEKVMPSTLIMNDNFTVESFKKHINQDDINLTHIASHGIFGSSASTSFIMAYDNVININELEQILKSEKLEKQPIEMLTLSACQTAEGNDRAPLGLAGIALKAKVRSAMGSLWSVSDEASAKLMTEFYKSLTQPNISKAKALQQAQIELLKQTDFNHPFYWSPFILVGNWL